MIQTQTSQIGRASYANTSQETRRPAPTPDADPDAIFGPCVIGDLGQHSSGTHVAATIVGGFEGGEIKIAEGAARLISLQPVDIASIQASLTSGHSGDRIVNNSWGGGGDTSSALLKAFLKTADSLGHQVGPEGFILAK